MHKPDNNIKIQENLKNKNFGHKFLKSQEILFKAEKIKKNFNAITENGKPKELHLFESSVNINKENKTPEHDNKNQKKYYIKGSLFPRSSRRINSGNIFHRSYNIKSFNSIDKIQSIKHNIAKNSYFMINNFSRHLTNDKSRNKDKYINNKLKQLKTFNKNHAKLFGNGIIEDESINSDNEKRKISSKKKKPIKERETSDYERFWIDEVNAKLMKKEEEKKKKKINIKIKYNEKVFSRNNQILPPFWQLKKKLAISTEENSKTLKNLINSISIAKTINTKYSNNNKFRNHITKSKNEKILKKIIDLNGELNACKYFLIADLINRKKELDKKISGIENKMNQYGSRKLVIKNIIYEKLNSDQKESIINATNQDKSLNELISSFDNIKTKKFPGFLDKKFLFELKKMNNLNIKDSIFENILDSQESYYLWKQNIINMEEEKIKKDRKNLSENIKKIKNLTEIIYKKKRNNYW